MSTDSRPAATIPARPAAPARPFGVAVAEFVSEWTVTILLLLFGTTTLVQAFVVPTGSMESNILIGDHVLVDKLAYAPGGAVSRYLLPYQEVRRGDVIVFRYPLDLREMYVKRVIGVPGDRIRLRDKQLELNGKRVAEPYVQHTSGYKDPYRDDFPAVNTGFLPPRAAQMLSEHVVDGELVVPPGQYFAMGDNRDNSADSRYWGFVPRENIVGRPLMVFWSYDAPTERLVSRNIIDLDHALDLARNFFTKTRWERTFLFIRSRTAN